MAIKYTPYDNSSTDWFFFFFFGLEIKGYLMKHENYMKLKLQYP